MSPIWSDGKTDVFWAPAPFDYDKMYKKPCEDEYGLTPDPVMAVRQFGDEKAFFHYENMLFT